jgi:pentatricopeptide repeat protein
VTGNNKQLTVLISKIVSSHPEVLDNTAFYESWMRGLAGLGRYSDALRVVDAMVERGVRVTNLQAASLAKALLKKKQVEAALSLLTKIERRDDGSCLPSPTGNLYAPFIQYGSRRGDHEFVHQIMGRMQDFGAMKDNASFLALTFYFYRYKNYEAAFKLFQDKLDSTDDINDACFRAMWLVIRDFYRPEPPYRQPKDSLESHTAQVVPDVRKLVSRMMNARDQMSKATFEHCVEALLFSEDRIGVASLLCYMDRVRGLKLDTVLIAHLFKMAENARRTSRFLADDDPTLAFFREKPFEKKTPEDSGVPWSNVVEVLCDKAWKADVALTLEQAEKLSDAFKNNSL